MNKKVLH